MNKPSHLSVVRTSPQASASVHRVDKRREEQHPPKSPLQVADPVPIEVRRQRVRNGSRRQRDLVAVREADLREREAEAQELTALLAAVLENPVAISAWDSARDGVRANVPGSTFRIWIEPLAAVGADGTTLVLAAPEGIRAWAERRYAALIAEALRHVSDFEAVQFVTAGGER